jgi:hypothetical protein
VPDGTAQVLVAGTAAAEITGALADSVREQHELDEEPTDRQPWPAKVDRRQAAQPDAEHEAQDEPDQDGIQDEHERGALGRSRRAVSLPGPMPGIVLARESGQPPDRRLS